MRVCRYRHSPHPPSPIVTPPFASVSGILAGLASFDDVVEIDDKRELHRTSALINLASTFLYMVNYYIVGPTSAEVYHGDLYKTVYLWVFWCGMCGLGRKIYTCRCRRLGTPTLQFDHSLLQGISLVNAASFFVSFQFSSSQSRIM